MSEPEASRRSFLAQLFGGSLLAGGAGLIASVLAYLVPPEYVRAGLGPQRVKVGKADDLVAGQGKLTLVEDEPVWVVRTAAGFTGVSALCTHKGCIVKWNGERRLFVCPCHEGLFDERGNVISGLPRHALTRFRVGQVSGDLYVARGESQRG